MRRLALLLLVLPASFLHADETEGTVALKDYNFEISTPPDSIDWEVMEINKDQAKTGLKVHLKTEYADADPPAAAHVFVYATPLSKEFARLSAEKIAKKWKDAIENMVENKEYKHEGASKIGGVDCWYVDVTGTHATFGGTYRLHWAVILNGNWLYQYYVHRSYAAVKDEDVDEELKQIRESFKFYEIAKVKAHKEGGSKGEGPAEADGGAAPKDDDLDPEVVKRKEITEDFWKFKAVKPEGLIAVPAEKFDKTEKANSQVLKFERRRDQAFIQIRVFAKSLKGGGNIFSLEKLAESRIKHFEKRYKKATRKKPEIDKKWKLGKLSKKNIKIRLLGRRSTSEITTWYMSECKNDRQYQISIYVTGATGETVWKNQIEDFLKNFVPFK